MNTCALCASTQISRADEMLRSGASQAQVARATGFDRQIVGRHVRNGHVTPAPALRVWEWSDDEARAMAMVDSEFVSALAAMTRIPKAELRRCLDAPRDHGECRACEAIDANDVVLAAIDARVMSHLRPEPGRWVTT